MVEVSKCPDGNRDQEDEKGRYRKGQMYARVRNGLIGVHPLKGIEWHRS